MRGRYDGRWRRPVAALLVATVATVAALATFASGPASADPPLFTVVWPEATALNPDLTPYAMHVESSVPGGIFVVASSYGHPDAMHLVPASGDVEVVFPADGTWEVRVRQCVDGTCTFSASRTVEIRRALAVRTGPVGAAGPLRPPHVRVGATPVGQAVDLVWSLARRGSADEVVASGSQAFVSSTGLVDLEDLALPEGSATGTYLLTLDLAADTDDFGRLEGTATVQLLWDVDAPEAVPFTLSDTEVYPARDGYRDEVRVVVPRTTSAVDLSATVTSPRGRVVARFDDDELRRGRPVFTGRSRDGVLATGRYLVTVTATDQAGNATSASLPVSLRPERLTWVTTTRTFRASSTVTKRVVGACSTLSSPARHGPRGSLGYYSQTRCDRPDRSAVVTSHEVRLPPSHDSYRDLQLVVNGGRARGEQDAYAVLYYDFDGEARFHAELDGAQGAHPGAALGNPTRLLVRRDGHAAFRWLLGLTQGSRYDVRSFTVEVDVRRLT